MLDCKILSCFESFHCKILKGVQIHLSASRVGYVIRGRLDVKLEKEKLLFLSIILKCNLLGFLFIPNLLVSIGILDLCDCTLFKF